MNASRRQEGEPLWQDTRDTKGKQQEVELEQEENLLQQGTKERQQQEEGGVQEQEEGKQQDGGSSSSSSSSTRGMSRRGSSSRGPQSRGQQGSKTKTGASGSRMGHDSCRGDWGGEASHTRQGSSVGYSGWGLKRLGEYLFQSHGILAQDPAYAYSMACRMRQNARG